MTIEKLRFITLDILESVCATDCADACGSSYVDGQKSILEWLLKTLDQE